MVKNWSMDLSSAAASGYLVVGERRFESRLCNGVIHYGAVRIGWLDFTCFGVDVGFLSRLSYMVIILFILQ